MILRTVTCTTSHIEVEYERVEKADPDATLSILYTCQHPNGTQVSFNKGWHINHQETSIDLGSLTSCRYLRITDRSLTAQTDDLELSPPPPMETTG